MPDMLPLHAHVVIVLWTADAHLEYN